MNEHDGLQDSSAASTIYEQDLGASDDGGSSTIEHGTVGWAGDPQVFDQQGSDSNDGYTLLKVTLFKGHPTGEPMAPGVVPSANGYRILVRLSWPLWALPLAGNQCVVAFPAGLIQTPGAGILIAVPMKSPVKQFSATTSKLDLTGYDLVIKARSISLRDDDNNLISISPEGGVRFTDKTGSGVFISGGEIIAQTQASSGKVMCAMTLTQDTASMLCAAASPQCGIKLKGGDFTATCNNCNLGAFGAICLGSKATPATCLAVGPAGAPGIATICSQSIMGQL